MKTYRDLLKWLNSLSEEQLDCHISIEVEADEFIEIATFAINGVNCDETNVLDFGHPIICALDF